MVAYERIISESIRFAVQPRRWLPFVLLDAAALAAFLWVLLPSLLGSLVAAEVGGEFIGALAGGAGLLIVFGLISLWLWLAALKQAADSSAWQPSLRFAARKLGWGLLLVAIESAVIAGASLLPLQALGFVADFALHMVLSIVISLGFFLAFALLAVRDTNALAAAKESWLLLRRRPVPVVLMAIIAAVVSGVILLLGAVPALALFWEALLGAVVAGTADPSAMVTAIIAVLSDLPSLFSVSVVFLVAATVGSLFSLAAAVGLARELAGNGTPQELARGDETR